MTRREAVALMLASWVVGAIVALSLAEARAARVDTLTTRRACELKIRPPEGKTQTVTIEARWSGGQVVCTTLLDQITEGR